MHKKCRLFYVPRVPRVPRGLWINTETLGRHDGVMLSGLDLTGSRSRYWQEVIWAVIIRYNR